MKKNIIIYSLLIVLIVFSGCSNTSNNNKDNTSLNKSISNTNQHNNFSNNSDIENNENNNLNDTNLENNSKISYMSVKNTSLIYEFINQNVVEISKETFKNNFIPHYFDLNNDGHNDVCYNTKGTYNQLIFIVSAKDNYKILPSETNAIDKISSIKVLDNFLIIEGVNSENKINNKIQEINYISKKSIKHINTIQLHYTYEKENTHSEGIGNIDLINGYNKFSYNYDQYHYDEEGNSRHDIKTELLYEFDSETLVYVTIEQGNNFNYLLNHNNSNSNYYEFNVNEDILFDLNNDGKDETINFNTNDLTLSVSGYNSVDIEVAQSFPIKSYSIINFSDDNTKNMKMICIYDAGPSADPVTTFYSIIDNQLVCVGNITAKIIPQNEYSSPYDSYDFSTNPTTQYLENSTDFMTCAFMIDNVGIESPIMLDNEVPQIWYGRTIITYSEENNSLIDTTKDTSTNYKTYSVLQTINDIILYDNKSTESENDNTSLVKAKENVLITSTDNQKWAYIISENGQEGWLELSEINHNNFKGFVVFG